MRVLAILSALALAACAGGEGQQTQLETFQVVGGQQRFVVDILDQGQGVRQIVVSSAGYRGLQRDDAAAAFVAAQQAGEQARCGEGQGVRVLPDSAFFIDETQAAGGLNRGAAAWRFRGRCGG
ncbi:MAG: hypothetical protein AAGI70_02870 [Pseudomonadota bacterium]